MISILILPKTIQHKFMVIKDNRNFLDRLLNRNPQFEEIEFLGKREYSHMFITSDTKLEMCKKFDLETCGVKYCGVMPIGLEDNVYECTCDAIETME